MSKGTTVRSVRLTDELVARIMRMGYNLYGTTDFSAIVRRVLTEWSQE